MAKLMIFFFLFLITSCNNLSKLNQRSNVENRILSAENLIALWSFDMKGKELRSKGRVNKELIYSRKGKPVIKKGGPISGYSIFLTGSDYLYLPFIETGELDIKSNEVTVMAWVNWEGNPNSFVAGMWNESREGGKRQYGLFLSLPYYNGEDQVCGHVSKTGKPTFPFPYSIDYSASLQKVKPKKWNCVAFTYDGEFIKSYLNGDFQFRPIELINHTKGFEGYPEGLHQSKNPYYFPYGLGNNGSDFTIGAVEVKDKMGNFYQGLIGGVAIFDRALTSKEVKNLSKF